MVLGLNELIEYAILTIYTQYETLNLNQQKEKTQIFEKFLKKEILYQEACSKLLPIIGGIAPIEKLNSILLTNSDPLPYIYDDSPLFLRKKSRPWTPYEDQRLLAGIFKFGKESWSNISSFVGNGRTSSQCSQRWIRGLNPKISKSSWNKIEEEKLLNLVSKYGEKSWTKIAQEMGNRSDVQCRYRFQQIQRELKNNNYNRNFNLSNIINDLIDIESENSSLEDNDYSIINNDLTPKEENIQFLSNFCFLPKIDPSIFSEE